MWHKVKELKSRGLNKSQIAQEVGIHRKTVGHYLGMSEEEFYQWIEKRKNQPLKLQFYYDFVRSQLEIHPYLSASQIEDRLKEHYSDLPAVHSKTVFNFVQSIRSRHDIRKPKTVIRRDCQKREETAYGREAQVDFGVYSMARAGGGRQKVWMFAMVLSRSRQKFVYLQTSPFTSSTAIYAHQLAFDYYGGVPHTILYDQDRVFMVDENLGDLLLTSDFRHYVRNESFEAVFCRKADPQTKGKIENVIKYVKYNFLRGREFVNTSQLNQSVIDWLSRTGNGKVHSTTRLIPYQQWLIEKVHLLPVKHQLKEPENARFTPYTVLKDHTISYKGNFYSLPLGTFKAEGSKVLVCHEADQLVICNEEKSPIATHPVCILKGKYIRNSDHARDKSSGIEEKMQLVVEKLGGTGQAQAFVEAIRRSKPRYLNDNLGVILSKANVENPKTVNLAIDYCLEHGYYNGLKLTELIAYFTNEQSSQLSLCRPEVHRLPIQASAEPSTSQIDIYEKIIR